MSRRIINPSGADSLQDEKQKADVLSEKANTAELRVNEAGDSLVTIKEEIAKVEKTLSDLGDAKAIKIAEIAKFEAELKTVTAELKKVEGEVSAALSGLEKIKAETQKAQSEHAQTLTVLAADHRNQMAVYEKTQSTIAAAIKELETKLEKVRENTATQERLATVFKREADRIEAEVLPLIPKRKAELETIERELLQKQVEVKDTEDRLYTVKGEYNATKAELDEAKSLKLIEEGIIAENMQKLVEKETEVERKIQALKVLQAGVDQSTERLKRREEEVELKLHLLAPRKEVITT